MNFLIKQSKEGEIFVNKLIKILVASVCLAVGVSAFANFTVTSQIIVNNNGCPNLSNPFPQRNYTVSCDGTPTGGINTGGCNTASFSSTTPYSVTWPPYSLCTDGKCFVTVSGTTIIKGGSKFVKCVFQVPDRNSYTVSGTYNPASCGVGGVFECKGTAAVCKLYSGPASNCIIE